VSKKWKYQVADSSMQDGTVFIWNGDRIALEIPVETRYDHSRLAQSLSRQRQRETDCAD